VLVVFGLVVLAVPTLGWLKGRGDITYFNSGHPITLIDPMIEEHNIRVFQPAILSEPYICEIVEVEFNT
jgi:hypothetical protein